MSSVVDEVIEAFEPSPKVVSVMAGEEPAMLLALDVGTSGVRAALFNERGEEIVSASRHRAESTQLITSGALDADSIVQLVEQTVDDLLENCPTAARPVELIAISCFWHSLMGVDSDGRPTTPVLTWSDTAAVEAVNQLRLRYDEAEVHRRTGCRFHSSYWPAKLLWLRDQNPEGFNRTRKWISFGEYLGQHLFGTTMASISMASGTGLFNQATREWDSELVQELAIDPEKLSEIASQTVSSIPLLDRHARRWRLLRGSLLCPAIGDGAANSIGSGCVTKKKIALMVGTSGAMRVLFEDGPPSELPASLWCYRADRTRIVVGGALSDGGGLYAWIRDAFAFSGDSEEIERALQAMDPDSHGLTILPFWSGERSTGWRADARGAILGLTIKVLPIDILRAAMESVAYRFALIAKDLQSFALDGEIVASGNALHASPAWSQILADVLGQRLKLSGLRESSTRGAALLALEAAGKLETVEHFAVPIQKIYEPDMVRHARYQEALARQQKYEIVARPAGS